MEINKDPNQIRRTLALQLEAHRKKANETITDL